ncbi:unnamed protein product, partial [Symbiodinium pilosum]
KVVQEAFVPLPTGPTAVLNVIVHVPFMLLLNRLAGFSMEYQRFIAMYSLAPTLIMGFCYYYYLFRRSMLQISLATLAGYVNNWVMATAIAMVSFTKLTLRYLALLYLEKLLPSYLQGYISFPLSTIESSVQNVLLVMYGMGALLLVSYPLWQAGHRLVFELVGRKDNNLGTFEAIMEILYTTSQTAVVTQMQTALAVLQLNYGYPYHFIHYFVVLVEHMFFHRMVELKFAWLHKLQHEVQPLYRLSHLEHHICKGTYPTTPAAGIWEVWLEGGTLFFCNSLALIPYSLFHAAYSGANVVVHTMWPFKSCVQWHTLHHVLHSDVYALNIPSKMDEQFSRDVKQYKDRLQCSFFMRHENASDLAGFAMAFVIGVILHYGFGVGLFHVWHERVLHMPA